MENKTRREFIKIAGKTILVTSSISVFGLTIAPAQALEEDGQNNAAFFTDGYYDDGYYFDGYYSDGYYYDGYSTGINSYIPDSLNLGVSPNPSNGNFVLEFTAKASGLAEIFITDLIGRTVSRQSRNLNLGANRLEFSLDEITKGVYYLSVITAKGTGSVRLVIAK